jgi:hypothetical protein
MAVTYTNRKGYRKYKHYIGTLCSQSFRPRTASHAQTRDWPFRDRQAPAWHKKGEPLAPSCQNARFILDQTGGRRQRRRWLWASCQEWSGGL